MAHEDITHQVSKQPNTWILRTKCHLDITHQVPQNPTHWRYYARQGVSKLCFRKERGRYFRGFILQTLIVVLLPWTRLIGQIAILSRVCALYPQSTIKSFLQTRPWRGFPLVAPLPSGSNRAKNHQMLVPRWGFPLPTRSRQSPYVLWLHLEASEF